MMLGTGDESCALRRSSRPRVHIIILSEDLVKVHFSEVLTVSNGLKLAPCARSQLSPAPGGYHSNY